MTVAEFAHLIGGAKLVSKGQWAATCPAHDDTHAVDVALGVISDSRSATR
jgi:hypothetical protein